MFKKMLLFVFVLSIIFITPSFASDEDPLLAKAGDFVFRKSDLDRLLSYSPPYFREQLEKDPKHKALVVNKIMEQKIIADLARKEGFDKDEDIKEQFKYLVNEFLSREYLLKKVIKKIAITEEELIKHYRDNEKDFLIPEQVRAKHILIKFPFGAQEEEKKKALEKARGILEWLKKGESFAKLAETYSEDTASKERGGDLGYFSRGKMSKSFEEAAFSLNRGQISDVVVTDYGYHIIMVEDRRDARLRPFQEVKGLIEEQLKDKKTKSEVEEFVRKTTEQAGMIIFSDKITGK